jgi:isoamylase
MTAERLDAKALLAPVTSASASKESDSDSWLADNVLHPFVNGTGVLQIYDTIANKEAEPLKVEKVSPFTLDWGVQAICGAAGAILPYVVAAKLTGGGLTAIGDKIGAQGVAGRLCASEMGAQVLGAGFYDFAKKPYQGETRAGNAAGVMAGFAVFGVGNNLAGKMLPEVASSLGNFGIQGAGRLGVGTLGGLTSYEVSNRTSNALGQKNELTWDGRWQSMASGGFINFGLPLVGEGAQKLIDKGNIATGRGLSVDRYLKYSKLDDPELQRLASDNRLARVTKAAPDEQSSADIYKNTVRMAPGDGAEKLAHELHHLRLAKLHEPQYKSIANLLQTDPAQAQAQFLTLRAYMESQARATENRVQVNFRGAEALRAVDSPSAIGQQTAANGQSYAELWSDQWAKFKADPSYRPPFEYSGTDPLANGLHSTEQAATQSAALVAEKPAASNNDKVAAVSEKPAENDATTKPGVTSDQLSDGIATRLGATVTDKGINFAIHAPDASKVELLIYSDVKDQAPHSVVPLTKTGAIWHQFVNDLPSGTLYQYRVYGDYTPAVNGERFNSSKVVLDEYARAVAGSELPMNDDALPYDNSNPQDPNRDLKPSTKDDAAVMPKAVAVRDGYDWKGDHHVQTPMQDTIIYELNVKGFTDADMSLPQKLRGTYAGLAEKIPYLKSLGITAVELMPILQIDRSAWPGKNPIDGHPLTDEWGYNPLVYMAPDSALSSSGIVGQQVTEFKSMVKAMHDAGIEVILDVVYNHTREGNQYGPTVNYKGTDNKGAYLLKPGQPDQYADHTGCGDTVNTNDPAMMKLILDSLRYWVEEMHVDGFRFDLASIFKYDTDGTVKDKTPIIQAIENDPVLSKVKLIAEPWSIDQYDQGHFSDKAWSEWSGKFRDTVRKFVKGDTGQLAQLADYIAGSPSQYDQSKGRFPVNPVTVHDGYTLNDLYEYQDKHNIANGQNNTDGSNDNFGWNGGVEGPVDKAAGLTDGQKAGITQLRTQLMKNTRVIQMMSQGTPILLWGDEVRRTADGNNNYWVQEKANQMPWDQLAANQDMVRFTQMMNQIHTENAIGSRGAASIVWHGTEPNKPDFSDGARVIAWEYKPTKPGEKSLYTISNAYWEPLQVKLPDGLWRQLVNDALPSGQDIVTLDKAPVLGPTITLPARASMVLIQDPAAGADQAAQTSGAQK